MSASGVTGSEHGAMLTAALDLAKRGFRVFPLAASGKRPSRAGWQDDATSDPARIRELWQRDPAANVGVATGSGVYVVDQDGAAGIAAFDGLAMPPTLTARTGRGRHAFYRLPAGLVLRNAGGATVAPGIDGRGDGGYVVGVGSVHASGAVYSWEEDRAIADLPQWLTEKLAARDHREAPPLDADELTAAREAFERLPAGEREELAAETAKRVSRVTAALRALPVQDGNGRGQSIYGWAWKLGECVGAGALDLEAARAAIVGSLDPATADAHERSVSRGLARGVAEPLTVEPVSLGVAVGREDRTSNVCSYDAVSTPENRTSPPKDRAVTSDGPGGSDVTGSGARERPSVQTRYAGRYIDIRAELAKPPVPIPYRVGHLLADGTHVVISGRAGLGKSWLQLALAHGVSTGQPAAGVECVQGPAVLIDAEMGRFQLIDRIRSAGIGELCHAYNADGLDLTRPDDLAWLEALIRERCPAGGFVGLDSLRKLMGAASENDSDSMARAVGSLTTLAHATGVALATLHHEGWEAGRSRGSTAIVDQADAAFSLQRLPDELEDSGVRRLTCRGPGGKMRFGREPEDLYLRLSENGLMVAADRPASKAAQYRGAILAALPQKGKTAAAQACGTTHNNGTWRAAWDELEALGEIVKTATGWTTAEPKI